MPNADRNDNGIKKKKIGLISKKNHFGRAAHFFVHFFTIFFFFQDYNAKLSSYMLYGGN